MNKQEYIKTYKELNRKLDRADNKQTKLQNKKSTLSSKIYNINDTYRNTVYPCKKEILLKDFKDFKGQVINTNSHARAIVLIWMNLSLTLLLRYRCVWTIQLKNN